MIHWCSLSVRFPWTRTQEKFKQQVPLLILWKKQLPLDITLTQKYNKNRYTKTAENDNLYIRYVGLIVKQRLYMFWGAQLKVN